MSRETRREPEEGQGASLARRVLPRLGEVGQVVVPGAYAWAVTVVPAAVGRGGTSLSWVAAAGAFVGLVAGAFVAKDRPRLGHALGIWAFVVLSCAAWVLNPYAIRVDRIDPMRAVAGTFGWTLYALGWGTPWRPGRHPEDDPRAELHPKLEPRKLPPLRVPWSLVVATLGALACLALAWRAAEPGRAVMLQGVALAAAVALVTACSRMALAQGQKRALPAPRQRLSYAFPWLMGLLTLLVTAAAWWMAR
jgi:hypothetical protein